MRAQNVPNSKELKVFIKGAFVLIGLLFILSFGFAGLLLHFDRKIEISKNVENKQNEEVGNYIGIDENFENDNKKEIDKKIVTGKYIENNVFNIIYFLVGIPILVFILIFLVFSCIVKSYYENLYGSTINEGFIFKMKNLEIKDIKTENLDQKFLTQKLEMQALEQKIEDKIDDSIGSCLTALNTINSDSEKDLNVFLENLKKIIDLFLKWKGDNP